MADSDARWYVSFRLQFFKSMYMRFTYHLMIASVSKSICWYLLLLIIGLFPLLKFCYINSKKNKILILNLNAYWNENA